MTNGTCLCASYPEAAWNLRTEAATGTAVRNAQSSVSWVFPTVSSSQAARQQGQGAEGARNSGSAALPARSPAHALLAALPASEMPLSPSQGLETERMWPDWDRLLSPLLSPPSPLPISPPLFLSWHLDLVSYELLLFHPSNLSGLFLLDLSNNNMPGNSKYFF